MRLARLGVWTCALLLVAARAGAQGMGFEAEPGSEAVQAAEEAAGCGDYGAALERMREAMRAAPEEPGHCVRAGHYARKLGKTELAVRLYLEADRLLGRALAGGALDFGGDDGADPADALYFAAEAMQEAGKGKEARKLLKKYAVRWATDEVALIRAAAGTAWSLKADGEEAQAGKALAAALATKVRDVQSFEVAAESFRERDREIALALLDRYGELLATVPGVTEERRAQLREAYLQQRQRLVEGATKE